MVTNENARDGLGLKVVSFTGFVYFYIGGGEHWYKLVPVRFGVVSLEVWCSVFIGSCLDDHIVPDLRCLS